MENQQPAHQDRPPTQYPTGRGYGHDYMRGGEVFGGYGYSEREEYRRALTGEEGDESTEDEPPPESERRAAPRASTATEEPGGLANTDANEQDPPVPQLEHIFGLQRGGGHSRSFYVTQAQLQHRIYRPQRDTTGGEPENPSPS